MRSVHNPNIEYEVQGDMFVREGISYTPLADIVDGDISYRNIFPCDGFTVVDIIENKPTLVPYCHEPWPIADVMFDDGHQPTRVTYIRRQPHVPVKHVVIGVLEVRQDTLQED